MERFCGVDFGTSNSVIALCADDESAPVTFRVPSLIYFADDPESTTRRYCGTEAIDRYIGDGMSGRFFQSIKTVLPEPTFTHTLINGKRFTAGDLVAVILRYLRSMMEEKCGCPITRAVLGRPARFSPDDEREALAQQRLEAAASQAGFEQVLFEFEPVAGARSYLRRSHGESLVFVADHGGGTSDFTIMRIRRNAGGATEAGEILATHGIRAGGDDFDAELMWHRVVEQLGYGSSYESYGNYLPVPVHVFRIVSRWDQIHFLKTTRYREELRYYLRSSDNPLAMRRLIKVVEENLGLFLARAVEAAKITLSSEPSGVVDYHKDKLHIHEEVSRAEFNDYVAPWIGAIEEAVETTLARAGIEPGDVDRVFMTGGSSVVPAVRDVLGLRFGAAKLVGDGTQFESVAEGLARTACLRGLSA